MPTSKIEKLIEEATVDCHDEEECLMGFYNMLDDNLTFPCAATIAGTPITVIGIDLQNDTIVALCQKDKKTYPIDLLSLEFDKKMPGKEWIAAYLAWRRHEM